MGGYILGLRDVAEAFESQTDIALLAGFDGFAVELECSAAESVGLFDKVYVQSSGGELSCG